MLSVFVLSINAYCTCNTFRVIIYNHTQRPIGTFKHTQKIGWMWKDNGMVAKSCNSFAVKTILITILIFLCVYIKNIKVWMFIQYMTRTFFDKILLSCFYTFIDKRFFLNVRKYELFKSPSHRYKRMRRLKSTAHIRNECVWYMASFRSSRPSRARRHRGFIAREMTDARSRLVYYGLYGNNKKSNITNMCATVWKMCRVWIERRDW